jgi:gamma-glutamyl-gamma-aminobutyrate hydrolase PuuD
MNLQGWRYHVVGGDTLIEKMMDNACAFKTGLREADLVVFSGGTDISVTMYNEFTMHALTQMPDTERDRVETAIYHAAVAKKKTLIGICRGAQLLNVLNGGRLWQHVDRHWDCKHDVVYISERLEKRVVSVTSDHHQMMRPNIKDSRVLAWTKRSTIRSTGTTDDPREPDEQDPEIVWYPGTKSLCFQPHPEWGLKSCEDLFYDCVKRVMIGL